MATEKTKKSRAPKKIAVTATPAPLPAVSSHASTHKFTYGVTSSSYQSCVCGAEQNLILRAGAAVRLYRLRAVEMWSESIDACAKSAGVVAPPAASVAAPVDPHQSEMMASLTRALEKQYPEAFAPELIDGTDVAKVDMEGALEIAFSPVLQHRDDINPVDVVELGEGRYRVYGTVRGVDQPTEASADEVKIMRARYLLTRGAMIRALPSMDYRTRKNVVAVFFKGHEPWLPPAGSPLAMLERGGSISIPRDGDAPIDFLAVVKALTTPGGAVPTVCPTLPPTLPAVEDSSHG